MIAEINAGTDGDAFDLNYDGSVDFDDLLALLSLVGDAGRGVLGYTNASGAKVMTIDRGYSGAIADRWLADTNGDMTFMHMRFRYYDASRGTWTRRDPIGYHDGLGLYEYVRSMPVLAYDPMGLALAIGGGGGGGCATGGCGGGGGIAPLILSQRPHRRICLPIVASTPYWCYVDPGLTDDEWGPGWWHWDPNNWDPSFIGPPSSPLEFVPQYVPQKDGPPAWPSQVVPSRGNCYRYGCDSPVGPKDAIDPLNIPPADKVRPHSPAPGGTEANLLTCDDLLFGALQDGLVRPDSETGKCPKGAHRVVFSLSDNFLDSRGVLVNNFHVWREKPKGVWKDKDGFGNARRLPGDPRVITVPGNLFPIFCNFELCVPKGFRL